MLDDIRELYDYSRWANHRVLDASAALAADAFERDLGNSFPSVRATLAHILGAEWIWLSRWNGTSPTSFPDQAELASLPALRGRWERLEREQQDFLDGLTEERLRATVPYRSMKGEPFAERLHRQMRHLVNHSTYHRGQVTTMLRQLGVGAVSTDLIVFYREREETARPR